MTTSTKRRIIVDPNVDGPMRPRENAVRSSEARNVTYLTRGRLYFYWAAWLIGLPCAYFYGVHTGAERGYSEALKTYGPQVVRLPIPAAVDDAQRIASVESAVVSRDIVPIGRDLALSGERSHMVASDNLAGTPSERLGEAQKYDFGKASIAAVPGAVEHMDVRSLASQPDARDQSRAIGAEAGGEKAAGESQARDWALRDLNAAGPSGRPVALGDRASLVATAPLVSDMPANVAAPQVDAAGAVGKVTAAELGTIKPEARRSVVESVAASSGSARQVRTKKSTETITGKKRSPAFTGKRFAVQVAAPSTKKDALALARRLTRIGHKAEVQEVKVRGAVHYRVLAASSGSQAEADRRRQRIAALKLTRSKPFVQEIPQSGR